MSIEVLIDDLVKHNHADAKVVRMIRNSLNVDALRDVRDCIVAIGSNVAKVVLPREARHLSNPNFRVYGWDTDGTRLYMGFEPSRHRITDDMSKDRYFTCDISGKIDIIEGLPEYFSDDTIQLGKRDLKILGDDAILFEKDHQLWIYNMQEDLSMKIKDGMSLSRVYVSPDQKHMAFQYADEFNIIDSQGQKVSNRKIQPNIFRWSPDSSGIIIWDPATKDHHFDFYKLSLDGEISKHMLGPIAPFQLQQGYFFVQPEVKD